MGEREEHKEEDRHWEFMKILKGRQKAPETLRDTQREENPK